MPLRKFVLTVKQAKEWFLRYPYGQEFKPSLRRFSDPKRKRSRYSGNTIQKATHTQLRSVWESFALLITRIKKS